jgi:hypothetical protein
MTATHPSSLPTPPPGTCVKSCSTRWSCRTVRRRTQSSSAPCSARPSTSLGSDAVPPMFNDIAPDLIPVCDQKPPTETSAPGRRAAAPASARTCRAGPPAHSAPAGAPDRAHLPPPTTPGGGFRPRRRRRPHPRRPGHAPSGSRPRHHPPPPAPGPRLLLPSTSSTPSARPPPSPATAPPTPPPSGPSRAWLLALPVTRLTVLRAHLLPARGLNDLLALRVRTGVRLYLVCHQPQLSAVLEQALARTGYDMADADAVLSQDHQDPPPTPRPRPTAADTSEWISLPALTTLTSYESSPACACTAPTAAERGFRPPTLPTHIATQVAHRLDRTAHPHHAAFQAAASSPRPPRASWTPPASWTSPSTARRWPSTTATTYAKAAPPTPCPPGLNPSCVLRHSPTSSPPRSAAAACSPTRSAPAACLP